MFATLCRTPSPIVSFAIRSTPPGACRLYRTPRSSDSNNRLVVLASELQTSTSLAERLDETQLWRRNLKSRATLPDLQADEATKRRVGRPQKKAPPKKGDRRRVNIVSDKLCDDILAYAGHSLEKHKGCDIIDINPGAGLWSRKLHDFLQPRSHILLEPDAELYEPFLEPLLKKPGTRLVAKSGIIWHDMLSVLTPEYLPHQKAPPRGSDEALRQNDTLLVTGNLAFHPRKKFRLFDSITVMILHQFIDAIRMGSLFQKYGRVRLLLWTRHDDKSRILPKSVQRRKRMALLGELSCDHIQEICGIEGAEKIWFKRDINLDRASALWAAKRMQDAGVVMPEGRETKEHIEALVDLEHGVTIDPGSAPPAFNRAYEGVLAGLEDAVDVGELDNTSGEEWMLLKKYTWRQNQDAKYHRDLFEFQQSLSYIIELKKSGGATPDEIKALEAAWHEKLNRTGANTLALYNTYRDNLHYVNQNPPLMHWDRRKLEPMKVNEDEFYPNVECSLMDIQPRAMHPYFRETGADSNRAGDCFELISQSLMSGGAQPLDKALDGLWPGAADYVIPRCDSLRDPDRGGVPVASKFAALTARMLNADQWEELLQRWMEWPFRPSFYDLISRTQEEGSSAKADNDSEGASGAGAGEF